MVVGLRHLSDKNVGYILSYLFFLHIGIVSVQLLCFESGKTNTSLHIQKQNTILHE